MKLRRQQQTARATPHTSSRVSLKNSSIKSQLCKNLDKKKKKFFPVVHNSCTSSWNILWRRNMTGIKKKEKFKMCFLSLNTESQENQRREDSQKSMWAVKENSQESANEDLYFIRMCWNSGEQKKEVTSVTRSWQKIQRERKRERERERETGFYPDPLKGSHHTSLRSGLHMRRQFYRSGKMKEMQETYDQRITTCSSAMFGWDMAAHWDTSSCQGTGADMSTSSHCTKEL